jgi:hypothetical protein
MGDETRSTEYGKQDEIDVTPGSKADGCHRLHKWIRGGAETSVGVANISEYLYFCMGSGVRTGEVRWCQARVTLCDEVVSLSRQKGLD